MWHFYVSCSQDLWKTCPVMAEKSDDSEFTCYYPGCGRSFNHYKNLLRHYQLQKLHKSTEKFKKRPLSAKQAVLDFLSELPAVRRQARVKETVKWLTADELHNLALPHLIGVISPWQFLLNKVSRTSVAVGLPQAILHELDNLKQTLSILFRNSHSPQSLWSFVACYFLFHLFSQWPEVAVQDRLHMASQMKPVGLVLIHEKDVLKSRERSDKSCSSRRRDAEAPTWAKSLLDAVQERLAEVNAAKQQLESLKRKASEEEPDLKFKGNKK